MLPETEYPPRLLLTALLSATIFVPLWAGIPLNPINSAYVLIHPILGLSYVLRGPRKPIPWSDLRRSAEIMFFVGLFLGLFAYIFASNANMDYVQRFAADGGNIQLAPDTSAERRLVLLRYVPLLLTDLVLWMVGHARVVRSSPALNANVPSLRSPVLVLVSVVLSVMAYPSFVNLEGLSLLGWVALAPFMYVVLWEVERAAYRRAVGYGVLYGVLFTLLGNFWLGTFSLISLQAVGLIFLGFYGLFMLVLVVVLAPLRRRWVRALAMVLAWCVFELARSSGFLGYPWHLVAHTQYQNTAMIQVAAIGGVWLVSLIVLVVNACIAVGAMAQNRRSVLKALGIALLVLTANYGFGLLMLDQPRTARGSVRLALIQQNSDPRKHDYRRTLDSLMGLTDQTLQYDPDMVVWSETAFVPNIRRWSQEDPARFRLARLVNEFLDYQAGIDTWLLTGNDDYRRRFDADGEEVARDSFNAAVLLDPAGRRSGTYHKIRLVPFTEHFPYQEQLPWVYDLLRSFDVSFWTPGQDRTIFEHPAMRFATPICFEDAFPQEVRHFADLGMEVIVNITNDYWSLQEVAAQQHFAAALFRTVELRRPMVRSTASGVTSHVDATGRIIGTRPQFSEQFLIADVAVPDLGQDPTHPQTLYQRFGEWVPVVAGIAALLISVAAWGSRRVHSRPKRVLK